MVSQAKMRNIRNVISHLSENTFMLESGQFTAVDVIQHIFMEGSLAASDLIYKEETKKLLLTILD